MGRWIKRIAFGLAGIVLLAVAAAAVFVATFDAEDYKQDIAAAFEAATGRKVHFGGKIEASILTLQPAITVHEPALLNPPGYSRPELAKAKRVHLIVRLRPLLRRRLAIVRLEVEGADVLFETNAKGERNWREKGEAPGLTPIPNPGPVPGVRIGVGQSIAGLTVDRLFLKSSRIAYLHGATKLEAEINFDEIGIVIPAADKPIDVKVAGTFQDAKIATSGQVGSLDTLLNPRPGVTRSRARLCGESAGRLPKDTRARPGLSAWLLSWRELHRRGAWLLVVAEMAMSPGRGGAACCSALGGSRATVTQDEGPGQPACAVVRQTRSSRGFGEASGIRDSGFGTPRSAIESSGHAVACWRWPAA